MSPLTRTESRGENADFLRGKENNNTIQKMLGRDNKGMRTIRNFYEKPPLSGEL